jgi:hypothetical protein
MCKAIFLCSLLVAALAAEQADAAGLIDQLKAGKLQCYGPTTAKRTCAALSGYAFDGGTIMNKAEVLISADPVGVMTTNSPVTLNGDAICGIPFKKDIDAATITSGGQMLTGVQADRVKAQIWANMAPNEGKELCTTYSPNGSGGYTTSYTLGGKPDNIPSTTVILVDPKDGYRVAP